MKHGTLASLLFVAALSAQADSQALQRMAATERAFAAATAEVGVRDGFLTFFAADAVQLVPGSDGAHATLAHAPAEWQNRPLVKLPLMSRLMWEPFTGQVSLDGTIGWLTGSYVLLDQPSSTIIEQGAYFSVWKRQSDGTWRVWLDQGIALPDLWKDANPFRVAPDPDEGHAGVPGETLDAAERAVSAGGDAWAARLAGDVRLHRDGRMPILGRDAAAAWAAPRGMRYTVIHAEAAGSGDLGIALGGYDATVGTGRSGAGPRAEHGTWVRVWKRDLTDRWRVVFETSKAAR